MARRKNAATKEPASDPADKLNRSKKTADSKAEEEVGTELKLDNTARISIHLISFLKRTCKANLTPLTVVAGRH